jgi:hypothetical protein
MSGSALSYQLTVTNTTNNPIWIRPLYATLFGLCENSPEGRLLPPADQKTGKPTTETWESSACCYSKIAMKPNPRVAGISLDTGNAQYLDVGVSCFRVSATIKQTVTKRSDGTILFIGPVTIEKN